MARTAFDPILSDCHTHHSLLQLSADHHIPASTSFALMAWNCFGSLLLLRTRLLSWTWWFQYQIWSFQYPALSVPWLVIPQSCPLPYLGCPLSVILWPYLYPNCVHDIIPISSVPLFNHDLLSFPLIPSSTLNSSLIGNDNFGAYYFFLSTSGVSFSSLPSLDSVVHCYITLYIILYSWPALS